MTIWKAIGDGEDDQQTKIKIYGKEMKVGRVDFVRDSASDERKILVSGFCASSPEL